MSNLIGATVYDQFGAWTLERDVDGIWSANQGDCSILLLDQADLDRFGIEADIRRFV